MTSKLFLKALAANLYPILRNEGFVGSGNTLRRISEPVVHVFNVQGSSGGEQCYLNLGVHLTFLPTAGSGDPIPKSLKEYQCVFRERIGPPTGAHDGWYYGASESEMEETVACICEYWKIYGKTYFEKRSIYPDDFAAIIDEIEVQSQNPNTLLTYARIARHMGENRQAESLAEAALENCPERAIHLHEDLKQFLADMA